MHLELESIRRGGLITKYEKALNKKLAKLGIKVETRITFSCSEMNHIRQVVDNIIRQKQFEYIHKKDNTKEFERWLTGMLGELAVEKALHLKFRDESTGDSSKYAVPDLKSAGYNVGVKTFCYPNFPVVNRNIDHPQIFVLLSRNKTQAYVLGIADVALLKKNNANKYNNNLVHCKSMLKRKTAFSEIENLKKITGLQDLEKYKAA